MYRLLFCLLIFLLTFTGDFKKIPCANADDQCRELGDYAPIHLGQSQLVQNDKKESIDKAPGPVSSRIQPEFLCYLSMTEMENLDGHDHAYCSVILDGDNRWKIDAQASGDSRSNCKAYCFQY